MKVAVKKLAALPIIAAGILWGIMGLFVRKLNAAGLESMQIVQLRAMTSVVAIFAVVIAKDVSLFKIRLKDLWCFVGTGICSIVFFNYCYFKAIELASLSVAAVLLYTAPAIVMVLSHFLFHEKFTKKKLAALVMTFVGCVLVTGILNGQGNISLEGILAGLGAGLGYALYSIFGRYALERGYESLTITFYTFFIAFLGSLFLTNAGAVVSVAFHDILSSLISVGLGLICTMMPFFLYTYGLTLVENSKASIFATIEPVTATLMGIIVFHEQISADGIAGVLLVIAALIFCGNEEN